MVENEWLIYAYMLNIVATILLALVTFPHRVDKTTKRLTYGLRIRVKHKWFFVGD